MLPIMNLKDILSDRIGLNDIKQLVTLIAPDESNQEDLFRLLFDADKKIAFRAVWVMSHFSPPHNGWLIRRQNELIEEVMRCEHTGKRRVILNVLYLQPLTGLPRMDFLDFCLERIVSKMEMPGVQSLCIKIAYEMCRHERELLQELQSTLAMVEDEQSPAIHAAKRNVLKAISKEKGFQIR